MTASYTRKAFNSPARWPRVPKWAVDLRVRRFRSSPATEGVVKKIAATFLAGFNDTIVQRDTAASFEHASSNSEEFLKPFYVEGASMALAVANSIPFFTRASKCTDLIDRLPGFKHVIYAGWGWWYALHPFPGLAVRRASASNPADLFSAITIDGMAFARAFLFARPPRFDIAIPAVSYAEQRLWVQGYGRALWFLAGANASIIEHQRKRVGPTLAAEIDAGLGLATGFAGISTVYSSELITDLATKPAYLQGLAFGLTARAMSTPRVFSSWLEKLSPSQARHAKGLVTMCLVEPRSLTDGSIIEYTKWQDKLRAELQKAQASL